MKPAWRGVVLDDGSIWAWPTLLMDHNEAFSKIGLLSDYRARWRQWSADGAVDFDPGTSDTDRLAVQDWVERANG